MWTPYFTSKEHSATMVSWHQETNIEKKRSSTTLEMAQPMHAKIPKLSSLRRTGAYRWQERNGSPVLGDGKWGGSSGGGTDGTMMMRGFVIVGEKNTHNRRKKWEERKKRRIRVKIYNWVNKKVRIL